MVVNNIYKVSVDLHQLSNLPLRLHKQGSGKVLFLVATKEEVRILLSLRLDPTITIMHFNWQQERMPLFTGEDVTIFYDSNRLSLLRKKKLLEQFCRLVKTLRVIEIPNVLSGNKSDQSLAMWIEQMKHSGRSLLQLIDATPPYEFDLKKELDHA